ncbi:uncharacterized protein LOC111310571, partial [Durio zibethinus]|uniref:Uncharacterized protein LOC111310571 n=1 Tax=Durio zibethinus TaxID=66656 RepID=A0A6P6ALT2_DURZI
NVNRWTNTDIQISTIWVLQPFRSYYIWIHIRLTKTSDRLIPRNVLRTLLSICDWFTIISTCRRETLSLSPKHNAHEILFSHLTASNNPKKESKKKNGLVWKDEPNDAVESTVRDGDRCSTRKVVQSNCKTEEVEPGKFVRKCEKTEKVLRECIGRPVEVLQFNKEYTEDDVTEQVLKGNFSLGSDVEGPFDFPGLRSDMEAIERHFFGGVNRFFDAAEEMQNSFFDAFGDFYCRGSSSPPSIRRGIPIEGHPQKEASAKPDESGHLDLSGFTKDV